MSACPGRSLAICDIWRRKKRNVNLRNGSTIHGAEERLILDSEVLAEVRRGTSFGLPLGLGRRSQESSVSPQSTEMKRSDAPAEETGSLGSVHSDYIYLTSYSP